MVDNNDSFIREVNEELRSDQFRSAWKRYGYAVIAVAVLIVVGTAGHRLWNHFDTTRASDAGDRFLAALTLADQGRMDEAAQALAALETDGYGSYAVLARLRGASIAAEQGNPDAAVQDFNAIGSDTAVPEAVRNVAKMRAAWLLIDHGTYEQVSAAVEAMATPTNAMRHSAREALGLAAYKAEDMVRAREWFEQIVEDAEAPRNVSDRAQMLLDNITASGKAD
ncbi:tetratricopeptide repeat protein [Peteryoungia desertarenae]|uniref:Ancillary SecYEG translocon subunit n=1 Tax=Peteryoungia desertarenae TaxID=1813451 RepID=A0ABX6QI69_9HYPH|nr:tetratricopeptide repeat protein [Peteryoungia desertarenae]QLF68269.1 tetratricopeptide repeat protein [Peteryoungia desertarenae]